MADTSNSTRAPGAHPSDQFDDALARYLDARAVLDRGGDRDDDEVDRLVDRMTKLEQALLAIPATNLSEVRAKAEVLWGLADNAPRLADLGTFMADLVRLSGGEPSRVFDPEHWLRRFDRRGGFWAIRDDEVLLMQPIGDDRLEGLMLELGAAGAVDEVKRRIRERAQPTEVHHGTAD